MDGVSMGRFIQALRAQGLPATGGRTGYLPVYCNPLYEERSMWAEGYPFDAPYVSRKVTYERGMCPEAEAYWQRTLGLSVLDHQQSQRVLNEIAEAVAKAARNLRDLKHA